MCIRTPTSATLYYLYLILNPYSPLTDPVIVRIVYINHKTDIVIVHIFYINVIVHYFYINYKSATLYFTIMNPDSPVIVHIFYILINAPLGPYLRNDMHASSSSYH
jgi:hypothetical protein